MKTDFYTKVILTVIAAMLSVIAFKQIASPVPMVHAAGDTSGFGFAMDGNNIYVYDHANSTVTSYYLSGIKDGVTHLQ